MEKQKASTATRCEDCGGRLQKRQIKEFRDDLLGIDNLVLLDAVEQEVC
jgi:ssDNA-binding Zn-finger/Zn-ribbon topoisomerase 1